MRTSLSFAAFVIIATAVSAAPAKAADSALTYLLFANTSSHPFKVSGMTLGGKTCASCTDRTIAPGTVTMVKIDPLGDQHLKFAIAGSGSGTCNYDFAADGNSEIGDCGSSPKLKYVSGVHDELLFHTEGTPVFTLIYAYDPRATSTRRHLAADPGGSDRADDVCRH